MANPGLSASFRQSRALNQEWHSLPWARGLSPNSPRPKSVRAVRLQLGLLATIYKPLMSRQQIYDELFVEFQGFLRAYNPPLGFQARMATLCTMIHKRVPSFTYVGFYLVHNIEGNEVLEVGPYQGSVLACGRINIGDGVCGQAVATRRILNVPDVTSHPGYISCDDETLSELVIPLEQADRVLGVLDIDSSDLNFFQESDILGLQRLLTLL